MTTHATRLREIADAIALYGYSNTTNQLYAIVTALEATPDTAALEAKLAEWEKLGAECKQNLQERVDAKGPDCASYNLIVCLTAMLAKPDPLLIEAREILGKSLPWLDSDEVEAIAKALVESGIELGVKP